MRKKDLSHFEVHEVKLPLFTLQWPALSTPDKFGKYGFTAYFEDQKALRPLQDEIQRIIDECFGGKEPEENFYPLKEIDDDQREEKEYLKNFVARAKCTTKQPVKALDSNRQRLDVDTDGNPTPEILNEEIYAGAKCKAVVRVAPWYNKFNHPGISLWLKSVLKVADGPRLGGGGGNIDADYDDEFEDKPKKSGPSFSDIEAAFKSLDRTTRKEVLKEFEINDLADLPKADWVEFLGVCNE